VTAFRKKRDGNINALQLLHFTLFTRKQNEFEWYRQVFWLNDQLNTPSRFYSVAK